jgi:Cu(I)/Ag(I) efflux system protein CusF
MNLLRLILLGIPLMGALLSSGEGIASAQSVQTVAAAQVVADAEGTVISIDSDQARVTLKHGAIQALGMPAMTMVFRAAEPAMLASLKPGDAVRFKVVRTENHFTLTQLSRR